MPLTVDSTTAPLDTAALVAAADVQLTKALGRLWLAIEAGTTNECLKTRSAWELYGLAESLGVAQ